MCIHDRVCSRRDPIVGGVRRRGAEHPNGRTCRHGGPREGSARRPSDSPSAYGTFLEVLRVHPRSGLQPVAMPAAATGLSDGRQRYAAPQGDGPPNVFPSARHRAHLLNLLPLKTLRRPTSSRRWVRPPKSSATVNSSLTVRQDSNGAQVLTVVLHRTPDAKQRGDPWSLRRPTDGARKRSKGGTLGPSGDRRMVCAGTLEHLALREVLHHCRATRPLHTGRS